MRKHPYILVDARGKGVDECARVGVTIEHERSSRKKFKQMLRWCESDLATLKAISKSNRTDEQKQEIVFLEQCQSEIQQLIDDLLRVEELKKQQLEYSRQQDALNERRYLPDGNIDPEVERQRNEVSTLEASLHRKLTNLNLGTHLDFQNYILKKAEEAIKNKNSSNE